MSITASQVKELREATGIGMMECKKALAETNGDFNKAIIWLREHGMARAAKKSGRTTAEGVVQFLIHPNQQEAAIVELNCETDFSGKNADFRKFAEDAAAVCLKTKEGDVEKIKAASLDGRTLSSALTELITKVGENMQLRRARFVKTDNGLVVGYNHMGGKIGTLVVLEGELGDKAKAAQIGADIAMHVAASAPRFLTREEVTADELEQEKVLARKKLEGKPAEIIEKILVGQMDKFYAETCLVDQPFVKEPKITVSKYLSQIGVKANLKAFVRFQLGEGVEVTETNFADEVAAQLKNSK